MKRKRGVTLSDNEQPAVETETPIRTADRSARSKSSRRTLQQTLDAHSTDSGSDNHELDRYIWGEDEEDPAAAAAASDGEEAPPDASSHPRRGRKKKLKEREPSPVLQHLAPNERYFWDNRPGAGKTSNNLLPPNALLNHDEFFQQRAKHEEPHAREMRFLLSLHEAAFDQWAFEMKNEYNICLYGYGSKKALTHSLAEYLHETSSPHPRIVVVNGFAPNITLVDILNTVASTMFPAHVKLPSAPASLLELVLETLDSKPPRNSIYLILNSIDAVFLRRPVIQSALARLAAHRSIRLVATADTPNFPLLWDASLRGRFRFLFHDCTTFAPFDAETDAVESVNQLLGRSGRRIGGRDGVGFVLRSLPENARHLFRILVAEQVAGSVDAEELQDVAKQLKDSHAAMGIEYRVLYHKAREELVCSTEHQLRTLLKEFYDHQMVESRRDALGTERLLVPFRKEELESLLEDLVE